jgi:predicted dehydrogenase
VVGIYDPRSEQAAALAGTLGCRAYETLDALLSDPAVDAVTVLSPVEAHHDHATAALVAGKHVLVEKPVGATLDEVRAIADVARRTDRVCMPAHNYVYAPQLRDARRLLAEGAFGQVVSAWILYNLYHAPEIAAKYPGVLRQIMTHHFYSVLYLLGKPARLTALASETRAPGARLDREDQVAVLLQMPNGALVNLFAGFAADDHTSEPWTVVYKVLGTAGGTVYSWRDSVVLAPGAGLAWRYPAYESSFVHEVNFFVRHCILRSEPPLSTIDDAVLAQELIEAADTSIRSGCAVSL